MADQAGQLVDQIAQLHRETVARWHTQDNPDNPYEGVLRVICQQHQFNFLLWHEEDIARSRQASDAEIATVKRAIDRYNQQRNDWIERIDQTLCHELQQRGIQAAAGAQLNTETPGSAIDRLSIMALRIYHMREQLDRSDASPEHRSGVQQKLDLCRQQQADLASSLAELLDDIFAAVTGGGVRIPISALPFAILGPGSYVVTADLVSVGTPGISIFASDVTIDLDGHDLVGLMAGPAEDCIVITPGLDNVTVFNGSIHDWGGDGLDLGSGTGHRVSDLTVESCGETGVLLGADGLMSETLRGVFDDVVAEDRGGRPIRHVERCAASAVRVGVESDRACVARLAGSTSVADRPRRADEFDGDDLHCGCSRGVGAATVDRQITSVVDVRGCCERVLRVDRLG